MALKHNLREATCRVILKMKEVCIPCNSRQNTKWLLNCHHFNSQLNMSAVITDKLLPCVFNHYESVQKMIGDGVPLDKLAHQFYLNENIIHPAVSNRQSELDYLRAVAKCLLPRVCNNQNLDSKVFFSLGRELLACWVLLPLMDVLANPNWLNAMIIAATDKSVPISSQKSTSNGQEKVMFLRNFVERANGKSNDDETIDGDTNFLYDQDQLYMFMQFLKREGAVDLLRFYLDVENLNSELLDPKITTDPAKLSALHQQSQTLLLAYQKIMERDFKKPVDTLAEAQDDVKKCLLGKWQRAFRLTPEYFRLIYGNREIKETTEAK